jgi:2,5-dihydroxypyridine 5,6-dioxygenase
MPYFSNQILAGARNCIVECAQIKAGDNVLILCLIGDHSNCVEEEAIQALATVAQMQGARVQILWSTGMEKGWWDDVPPIVIGAFQAADVVINNTFIGRPIKAVREAMFGKGITMVRNIATTVEILSSEWALFPFTLSEEITKRVGMRLDAGKTWRVTHPNGTDVSGQIGLSPTKGTGHKRYGEYRRDGRKRPFPQGCFNPMTSLGANGIIVFDRTLPWEARHIGVPELKFDAPLKVTVENNKMIHFEGGPEAAAYKRFYEGLVPFLGEDAWNVSGWHAGIHPKARLYALAKDNPDFFHRRVHNNPTVLHFHLGGSLSKEYNYPYMWHLSNEMEGATVHIDGEPLYLAGHLTVLDDPALRKIAEKYGDPDKLLAQTDIYR